MPLFQSKSMGLSRGRRIRFCWAMGYLLLLGPSLVACKRSSPAQPKPTGSATARTEKAPRFACSLPAGAGSFTLGSPEPVSDEDEAQPPMPFGVTLGDAAAFDGGFAVGALRERGGQTQAAILLLDEAVAKGQLVELGRVYGDANPPKLVNVRNGLVVAVPDMDAGGRTLRIGQVTGLGTRPVVEWRGTVPQGSDESEAVAMQSAEGQVLFAWDDTTKRGQGVIHTQILSLADRKLADRVATHRAEERDVELPDLAQRPGGFWLAFASRQHRAADPAVPSDDAPAYRVGCRGLQMLSLDRDGRALGHPIDVVPPTDHVVSYSMGALPDGSAVLAYRDDDTAPGAERGAILIARVRLDGSSERHHIEDETIGPGFPWVLEDPLATPEDRLWLVVAGAGEAPRLARLDQNGAPISPLLADDRGVMADPLARSQGGVLVARSRGKAVEFERIACTLESPAGPAVSAAPGKTSR